MKPYLKLSDDELIQLLKQSDHSAYNEIYERYFYLIFEHAYKKLRDEEQAKDVVQDVFASLWYKREVSLPISNLGGYLFTAVRYKIFDLFARNEVRSRHFDSLNTYLNSNNSAPADYLIREKQLSAYIEKAIQALPAKMRKVFEMSRKENLSHREIATVLEMSENNVSKQVHNALRILKTKLGAFILICFLFRFL